MPLKCIPKNGLTDKYYVIYILPLQKQKKEYSINNPYQETFLSILKTGTKGKKILSFPYPYPSSPN